MKNTLNYFITILRLFPEESSKSKIVFILLLLVLGSILEFLNLAFIAILLSRMANKSITNQSIVFDYFSFMTDLSILNLLMIVVFVVCTKNIIQFSGLYYQNKFSHKFEELISNYLFNKDLGISFEDHLKKNTTNSQNEIITYAFNINRYFILPFLNIISDLIVLITILFFLVIFNPLITVVSILFFVFFIFIYNKLIGDKFLKWGKIKLSINQNKLKIIQESIGAYKPIILLNKKEYFQNKFENENKISTHIGTLHNSFNQMPKFYFEILIYSFLVIIILITNSFMDNNESIILMLGVYAASMMKVIPSFNKLASSYQSIKFSKYSLSVLEPLSSAHEINFHNEQTLTFSNEIIFDNISFSYGASSIKLFNDISFVIKKNTTLGIIGESGKGKTTLINILLGFLEIDQGNIRVDGNEIYLNSISWQSKIGYVPQDIYLLDAPIIENIAFGIPLNQIDLHRVKNVIKRAKLSSLVENEKDLYRKVGERGLTLSGGQIQRIGIARALYNDPEILIFDEATSALDNQTQNEILKTIESLKKDKTIVMISHDSYLIDFCDNIYTL